MKTQWICSAALVLATVAAAQPPAGRGRGGPGGPGGPGAPARFLGGEVGMPGRLVKNAPYSAEVVTETSQALPDGNRIKQSNTVRVFRDSEGRTRHEQSLRNLGGASANTTLPQVAFINDPVAGASYTLDLTQRTATKSTHGGWNGPGGPRPGASADPNGRGPMPRRAGPPPDGAPRGPQMRRGNQNVKTDSLGRQIVEGVQADGTRTTLTIPAGEIGNEQPIQVVTETWYSPELQTVVLRKRSDPRSGDSVTKVMNLSRQEPPRTLFEPPADFKISEAGRGPRPRQ